jgi:radical SAM superfamily enzyme YgiQ (UPF0313 family)
MKALLLYPEFPDTFWSFKHVLKFIGKRASLPPLGLLTVAAMLPAAWEKRLVDVNVRPLREKDLAWADVVLIGAMIAQRDSAVQLIARCHAAGKTIVAGGPLFTVEHTQYPDVDHFVLNEAEVTLPEFLRDLARGAARRLYTSPDLPDLRQTPAPLWELADLRRYASMSVQYSRGCPFDCDFCSVTAMFGHRPRVKTPAQIVAELDGLWRRGWRGAVFFVDDNFIGNQRSLREDLLPALIRWRQGKGFHQPGRRRKTHAADGRGGVRPGFHRHRDPGGGEPHRVQQAPEPEPRSRGRRQAHPTRGAAGAGRVHRRFRQRPADNLSAPDRFYPEERDRHRDGRVVAGRARHQAA